MWLQQMCWSAELIQLVVDKVARDKPRQVVMVVPDLPCELWFRRLEAARTDWQMLQDNLAGVKETDMILDQQGHGVGLFVFEL